MNDIEYLKERNCFTANIRRYPWLTKHRYFMKKNTTKMAFDTYNATRSPLLYSDFLCYFAMISEPINIDNRYIEVFDHDFIDKTKIIVCFNLVNDWADYFNSDTDDCIIETNGDIQSAFINTGCVSYINIVEITSLEGRDLVWEYLIKAFNERGVSNIMTSKNHPATKNFFITITPDGV